MTNLTTGLYTFSCVHIGAGGVVSIYGAVTIMTTCFTLDAGATISGTGNGYLGNTGGGPGVGWGGAVTCACVPPLLGFGGGGGHGGAGATFCDGASCAPGGTTNDNPANPTLMGSAGGNVQGLLIGSGSGGALLKIIVYDPVANAVAPATVNGTIDMTGGAGGSDYTDDEYSGGGAGGAVYLEASTLSGTGLVQANGGAANYSGGGGGGLISFLENLTSFPGTTSVVGGISASSSSDDGAPGTVTFTTAPVSGYL